MIERFGIAEVLALGGEIWDKIAAHPEAIELTESQQQSLDARLETYRTNPQVGSSWDEVQACLRAVLRR